MMTLKDGKNKENSFDEINEIVRLIRHGGEGCIIVGDSNHRQLIEKIASILCFDPKYSHCNYFDSKICYEGYDYRFFTLNTDIKGCSFDWWVPYRINASEMPGVLARIKPCLKTKAPKKGINRWELLLLEESKK